MALVEGANPRPSFLFVPEMTVMLVTREDSLMRLRRRVVRAEHQYQVLSDHRVHLEAPGHLAGESARPKTGNQGERDQF